MATSPNSTRSLRQRLGDRLRSDPVRVGLGYMLLALVFTGPLYVHPTYAGGHLDWRFFYYLHESSRRTLLDFGQFPLWNPWGCGGNVHLANAQTQFLSPLFSLILVFGVAIGQKLFILLHYWLGLVGMHALVRREGRSNLAAIASSLVFALCGFHAMRAGGGHAAFLPFLYLPWLLLAYRAARDDLRHAILLGLVVAETVFEGGIYPTAFFVVLLIFEAAYDLITGELRRWRPVAIGALAAAVFLSVAAIKLGPVLQYLSESPRLIPLDDRLDLTLLLKAFLSRSLERSLPGHPYVWHEYINYIGFIPVAALLFMWPRRDEEPLRRWYAGVIVFVLIMIGDHGWLSPYALLHHIPVYKSLRVPSRWGVLVVLNAALIFGVFANWLDFRCEDRARTIQRRWLAWPIKRGAWILVFLAALDMGITNGRLWWPGFNVKPRARVEQPLFQGYGNGGDMWWRVASNEGTPHCYEVNPLPTAKGLWRGKGPQAKIVDDAGDLENIEFSPNRWSLDVDLTRAGRVIINQNYHRFWRTRAPATLVEHEGLLALDLPAGRHHVELWYWPRYLSAFIASSAVSLPLWFGLWWWLGRRRR